jgi:predicted phage tail protein
MKLKKIKVYGKLRQFLGRPYFMAAVKSPQQAMSFLIANFEGIQKHMNDQIYKIKMGGRVITEEYLSMSGQGDIQIIPIATGTGPAIPIFIGGLSIAGAGTIAAAVGGGILGAVVSYGLTVIGTELLIGGITDLLVPKQSTPDNSSVSAIDPAIRGSYSFSGIQNVSNSGVPIPILYGSVFSGSIIISSGTDSTQVVKSIT